MADHQKRPVALQQETDIDIGDTVYTAALLITVWATVVATGIAKPPHDLRAQLSRRSLIVRIALLDAVVVPLLVWALTRLLDVPSDAATGLILVAAAAAGPLGFKLIETARGDRAFGVVIIIALQLADVVTIPVFTTLLLPQGVAPPLVDIVRSVVLFIVLPLAVGWAVRARLPARAAGIESVLTRISSVGLVVVVLLVLARNLRPLVEIAGSAVPLIAVVTIVTTMLLGWAIGGPERPTRISAALVTGARASALALAIAGTVYAATPTVSVAVAAFGLIGVLIPSAAALALSRGQDQGLSAGAPAPEA